MITSGDIFDAIARSIRGAPQVWIFSAIVILIAILYAIFVPRSRD